MSLLCFEAGPSLFLLWDVRRLEQSALLYPSLFLHKRRFFLLNIPDCFDVQLGISSLVQLPRAHHAVRHYFHSLPGWELLRCLHDCRGQCVLCGRHGLPHNARSVWCHFINPNIIVNRFLILFYRLASFFTRVRCHMVRV